jgi:hypothetical protein
VTRSLVYGLWDFLLSPAQAVGTKAQALRMTSRGNDLSSAAAVLFVFKEVMHVCDDGCPISVQSVYEEGRDGNSK